jgi:hypothetical protein
MLRNALCAPRYGTVSASCLSSYIPYVHLAVSIVPHSISTIFHNAGTASRSIRQHRMELSSISEHSGSIINVTQHCDSIIQLSISSTTTTGCIPRRHPTPSRQHHTTHRLRFTAYPYRYCGRICESWCPICSGQYRHTHTQTHTYTLITSYTHPRTPTYTHTHTYTHIHTHARVRTSQGPNRTRLACAGQHQCKVRLTASM